MIEVFKTAVTDPILANLLRDQIHRNFPGYKANFDLEDCDHILRVEHPGGFVRGEAIVDLLKDWDVRADVLEDDDPKSEFQIPNSEVRDPKSKILNSKIRVPRF